MGKVRARTLGDEEQEQKEKQEAEARRLAKIEEAKAKGRAEKSSVAKAMDDDTAAGQAKKSSNTKAMEDKAEEEAETPAEEQTENVILESEATPESDAGQTNMTEDKQSEAPKKKKKQKVGKAKERSAKYKTSVAMVEKSKLYTLSEALDLVEKTHMAKFDETVELHINTISSLNGSVTLPHGTGKSTRVAILAPLKDAKAADELLKTIESGKIEFDILLATPDAMPRLAKVARILAPKGLMPNPKNGTITPNPEAVAEKYAGGHMTFKTESKAPVLHLSVGKLSFGKDKLEDNIKAAFKAVDMKNMKRVTLKSTMSPGIKLQVK